MQGANFSDIVMTMRTWAACLALLGCSGSTKPSPDAASAFNVASAQALSTLAIAITFSDPPNPTEAAIIANYAFEPPVSLIGNSTLTGSTVTFGTMPQQGVSYQLSVSGVTRASDGAPLAGATTTFLGHQPFNVTSAASTGALSATVTFDAAPDPAQAMTAANFRISDPYILDVTGTPQLSGNTVTLTTSAQSALAYDVDVFHVTRASDHEPLYFLAATFTGTDHCTDGGTDGDETDIDCGGATCTARCTTGQACSIGADCASGTCSGTCT